MSVHYDEKGKFFTDFVTKEAIPTIIKTVSDCIRGNVYVRPDERLRDELNESSHYIAVTDAIVYDEKGKKLYETDFIAVNRDHIVWVIPDGELTNVEKEDES